MSSKKTNQEEVNGLTIGCIALSSSCHPDMISRSQTFFDEIGVKVRFKLDPSACYEKNDFLFSSDDPQKRSKGLLELAMDPSIDLIMSARGGYGALELLPLLDFEELKKTPKPFIGYSDTTALLIALSSRSAWPCVHGPVFGSFDSGTEQELLEKWSSVLRVVNRDAKLLLAGAALEHAFGSFEGELSGPLLGGSLTLLASLMGTPWEPDLTGSIFFFEEVGDAPYRLHRKLMQLKLAGKFNDLSAVLVGDLETCVHPKGLGPSAQDVVRDIFTSCNVPVFNAPYFGHGKINYPLPIGAKAKISSSKQLELV